MNSTTAPWPQTLRDHSRLNASRQCPIRVPPSQSATSALARSIAASTSRSRNWRVMLVSRVPKANECTRVRSRASACAKWSSTREYRLIDPRDVAQHHQRGRLAAPAPAGQHHRAGAEPEASAERGSHVDERAAGMGAVAPGRGGRNGEAQACDGRLRRREFGRGHLLEVARPQHLPVRPGEGGVELDLPLGFTGPRLGLAAGEEGVAQPAAERVARRLAGGYGR